MNPQVVDFINEIIAGTRIETIADFYPTLMSYDLTGALAVLAHTDVVIVRRRARPDDAGRAQPGHGGRVAHGPS